MTAICIPIFVKPAVNLEEIIEETEEALEERGGSGGGMLELRCDQATPRLMLEAIESAHLPVIVTVRPTWEGGLCEKDDEYRTGLWEAAIEAGVEFIDVELASWERNKAVRDRVCEAAEKSGTKVILSTHSFEGRPKDLEARVSRLRRVKQADVLKIAWKAESIQDGIEALALLEKLRREDKRLAIVLAMGEEGMISRLLARKFGAALTFAVVAQGAESAPGQPTIAELHELYRWESQRADTPVFGVAGWPVAQSKSPAIHNAGFAAVGAEGVYVPLPIRPGALAAAVNALRGVSGMNLRGISVTIPHKEAAFKYVCDRNGRIDDLSWRIGVLNTLVWGGENGQELRGFNSDYEGALDALVTGWSGRREDLAGKRVAVIGAGGAARAVVAGLVGQGATVVIYNRTPEKAETLAGDFGDAGKAIAGKWEAMRGGECDAWINCTPLGMVPNIATSPLEEAPASWGPQTVVFDTVYHPAMTRFLQLAHQKGCRIVKGTEMFIRQAAAQFRAFASKEAPVEVFRQALGPEA